MRKILLALLLIVFLDCSMNIEPEPEPDHVLIKIDCQTDWIAVIDCAEGDIYNPSIVSEKGNYSENRPLGMDYYYVELSRDINQDIESKLSIIMVYDDNSREILKEKTSRSNKIVLIYEE